MNELTIRICTEEDLDLLSALNKQLIEDEKHDNKMNTEQLKERMMSFINTDYKAYIFEGHDIEVMYWYTVGYEFWKSLGFTERSVYMRLNP